MAIQRLQSDRSLSQKVDTLYRTRLEAFLAMLLKPFVLTLAGESSLLSLSLETPILQ